MAGIVAQIKTELRPERLVASLSAGLVTGVTTIVIQISFAALIFSGSLAPYVSQGIGLVLFATLVMNAVGALASSVPGVIFEPQDGPAALMALMAAAVLAGLSGEAGLATVMAAIALTSLLAGLFFLLLGLLHQGALVRYVPYPVVGGFLAGTGWLLASGALGVMLDTTPPMAQLPGLFGGEVLIQWLPGVLLGIALLLALYRFNHPLILPGLLLGAVGLFYAILAVAGLSPAEASSQGWLLGPFPDDGLWQPLRPALLGRVHWPALLEQAGSVGTILVVSLVSLLLNASGLELVARRDVDLNRELKAAGLANVLAGLSGGGPVGYHALSISALSYRAGAPSRLVGLVAAALAGATLLAGPALLAYFPKMVLGGLIFFLGLDFLVEWLYSAWFRLSRLDYGIVVAIMVAMAAIGVLEGVGLGLGLAVVLFVVEYSRTGAVRHAFSGEVYRSHVDRSRLYEGLLRQRGERLYILELQGFLFFGTAHSLLEQVRGRLADGERPAPRFVVLDFRRVRGIDASAVISFAKMIQLAETRNFVLVLTHLSPGMAQQLARELPPSGEGSAWRAFPDLDHGVEWCEDQILATFQEVGLGGRPRTMMGQLLAFLPGSGQFVGWMEGLTREQEARGEAPADETGTLRRMAGYMTEVKIEAGQVLIRQGQAPEGLYFIEEGQVTIRVTGEEGQQARLRTRRAGTVVGEVGLYRGTTATATVVVDKGGRAYHLTMAALQRMEDEAPELAAAFHKFMAQHLSEQLAGTTELVKEVLDVGR
ncbi:MAG: SulP family inorganic anion transporter [Anaerolineae bacterium]|jgi:SulP family sulfate permease